MIEDGVARVARAFDAAKLRFCESTTVERQEDETSNMLHHLYRLVEQRGGVGFLGAPETNGHAVALCLIRNKDVHRATAVAGFEDVYTDYYPNLYGALVWRLPEEVTSDHRYEPTDAAALEGRAVIDTLAAAFNSLR